jgi:hypothetical protein
VNSTTGHDDGLLGSFNHRGDGGDFVGSGVGRRMIQSLCSEELDRVIKGVGLDILG